MEYEKIICSIEDRLATITLNHPENRNALSQHLLAEFTDAVNCIRQDREAGALVITGTGKSFCSGVDLKEMGAQQQLGLEERRKDILAFYKKATCFLDLAIPVIAAINGHAIGAGCALALACDMRIAAQGARLGLGFVKIGLHPGAGTTCILPRLVGTAKACELLMTGDPIDAEEAARIGLVNRVVPAEELQAATLELAAKIAKGPPIPMKMIKKALYQGQREDLEILMEYEAFAQALCTQTEDLKEGITAFIEKRAPVFKGQ
jgi:enoyl-CoA hydratase/carnithine racemase